MSESSAGTVVSGRRYAVERVGGRAPSALEDFAGETSLRLTHGAEVHEVAGVGRVVDGAVRFHEKRGDPGGKDVRVWRISAGADGFEAEHTP
ncbi:hypothetical protein [Kineococcus gypseus]|uniref:hypothetical protein n=1 Tax=Kineococcus gypseus TaxID=1637102 RepID=UPI003D7DA543